MSLNKVKYLKLNFSDIAHFLNLPKECEVVAINSGAFVHERSDTIHVAISHPDFPEIPDHGKMMQTTFYEIQQCKSSLKTTSSQP